jgi:sarcosine/dimethylglycine N-methyltransferase
MNEKSAKAAQTARDYYNSDAADGFYFKVWGGEHIHVGIYETAGESVAAASRCTVEQLSTRLSALNADARVLDIGSGYGGAARHLASTYSCRITGLCISEVENERHRAMNRAQGLDHLIEVVDGNFEDMPFEDESFDIVWSQDAMLHSAERMRVFREVSRVLRTGGEFIFTDLMMADGCPEAAVKPILDRLLLESMASPEFYRFTASHCGFEELSYEDLTPHMTMHYERVLEDMDALVADDSSALDAAYVERARTGLQRWVDGGQAGHLAWGVFHYRR